MQKYLQLSETIYQTAKQSVTDSPASLFTKEDVTRFLDFTFGKIADAITEAFEVPTPAPQQEAILQGYTREDVIEAIKAAISCTEFTEHVETDNDSAEFTIYNGNRIELEDVGVSFDEDAFTNEFIANVEEGLDEIYDLQKLNNA